MVKVWNPKLKKTIEREQTPEQIELSEQRKKEGKEFIQARERKLAGVIGNSGGLDSGTPTRRQREAAAQELVPKGEAELAQRQQEQKEKKNIFETERLFQERKAKREGDTQVPQELPEIPPEETEVTTPEEPQQEYYTDPKTGEVTPLYSGTVTPVTAEDLTDVISMFSGLGLAKIGVKGGFKKLLSKAGKVALPKAEATLVKKGIIKSISKAATSKMGTIALAVVVGQASILATSAISPFFSQKITAEDRQIRSLDADMSQVRETITLPLQLVKAGAPVEDCLEQLDSLRERVEYDDSQIKLLEINSYERKTNIEFTTPMHTRANKLRGFLDLAERSILASQVSGEAITTEQLNEIMETYESLFGGESE